MCRRESDDSERGGSLPAQAEAIGNGEQTRSFDEVSRGLGFDPDELRAEASEDRS